MPRRLWLFHVKPAPTSLGGPRRLLERLIRGCALCAGLAHMLVRAVSDALPLGVDVGIEAAAGGPPRRIQGGSNRLITRVTGIDHLGNVGRDGLL